MKSKTTEKTQDKHPVYGISRPIKIIGIITLLICAFFIAFGEYARREKIQLDKAAAAQRKATEAAAWPAKRAAMDRENAIAARQREEDYRRSQHAATMAQIKDVITRFYDLSRVADAAPPTALAGVIPQLQAIHRETQRLQLTNCMATAQTALASAFDETVNTYLARLQANAQAMQQHGKNAQTAIDKFNSIKDRCA